MALLGIYIGGKILVEKMRHKSLKYNFYRTKIEYIDGFFNKEEKELKYKFIREVTMSRNLLERICGIGTVRIYTNASNGFYNGILIHCLTNVEEKYKIIKQVIDEGTKGEY